MSTGRRVSTDDVFVHEVLSWTKTSAGACTTQFVAPRAGELTKLSGPADEVEMTSVDQRLADHGWVFPVDDGVAGSEPTPWNRRGAFRA